MSACPKCSTAAVTPAEDFLGMCPKCLLGLAVDAPSDPERVAGYEILGRLGTGGMGVVYRARQPGLGREVAVKLLAAGEDDERFLREARAAARLSHPGIVPIHEVGRHEGRPFFVMELVEGRTLGERLRSGPLPPRQAASVAAQVARALDHAHRAGILHRDVKPSNILLDRDDRVLLADFGVARDLTRNTRATASGLVLGTPAYMAPEQIEGEAAAPADIYALGVTLYECLAGRPPFDGSTPAALFKRVLDEEPEPPRARRRDVPRDLEAICLKALSKRPADRYSSPAELADDLERFLRDEPVRARRSSPFRAAGRAAARHRFVLALAAGLAFAGLLLIVRRDPPDETPARLLFAEARTKTDPRVASDRHKLLRQARGGAHSRDLIAQIEDALGKADASRWFLLLVSGGLPAGALDELPPEVRPFIEAAVDRLDTPAEALGHVDVALAHDPNSWRTWLVKSVAHLREDNPAAAREAARRARSLAPELLAAAAFEAVAVRHIDFAANPDDYRELDERLESAPDPVAVFGRMLLNSARVERGGGVVIDLELPHPPPSGDVPAALRPLRAWQRLLAEDTEGAREDLATSPALSRVTPSWEQFANGVREGVENPKLPWLLYGQAVARARRGGDPAPKMRELEAVLPAPGVDPAADFRYRRLRK